MEPDHLDSLFHAFVEEIRRGWTRCDSLAYRQVLDCLPLPVLLVDRSATVIDMNVAAIRFVGCEEAGLEKHLCGTVLRCAHADEGTCGQLPSCPCDIRVAVEVACAGKPTYRKKTSFHRLVDGVRDTRILLVSAAPFVLDNCTFAVVALEDITQISIPDTK